MLHMLMRTTTLQHRALPFLQGQKLPPNGLRVAAGLTQPQQRAQDGVDGASVQAAELQAPVGDLPEFEQRVLGADLVLPVVEVALDRGEAQPVGLLGLRWNLDLEYCALNLQCYKKRITLERMKRNIFWFL